MFDDRGFISASIFRTRLLSSFMLESRFFRLPAISGEFTILSTPSVSFTSLLAISLNGTCSRVAISTSAVEGMVGISGYLLSSPTTFIGLSG